MNAPENAPFCFSLNRKQGFEGPRYRPTKKFLHSQENVEGCCRAVNLAQNCLAVEAVTEWVDHIRSMNKDDYPLGLEGVENSVVVEGDELEEEMGEFDDEECS